MCSNSGFQTRFWQNLRSLGTYWAPSMSKFSNIKKVSQRVELHMARELGDGISQFFDPYLKMAKQGLPISAPLLQHFCLVKCKHAFTIGVAEGWMIYYCKDTVLNILCVFHVANLALPENVCVQNTTKDATQALHVAIHRS